MKHFYLWTFDWIQLNLKYLTLDFRLNHLRWKFWLGLWICTCDTWVPILNLIELRLEPLKFICKQISLAISICVALPTILMVLFMFFYNIFNLRCFKLRVQLGPCVFFITLSINMLVPIALTHANTHIHSLDFGMML